MPERDNIKYVQLDCDSVMVGSLDSAILVTTKITDSDVIDKVYEAIEQTVESADLSRYERQAKGYIFNETLTLTLKSGRKVTYNLYSSHNLYTILESSDDVQNQSVFMYEGEVDRVSCHKLTSDESLIVWEALREDYRNMTEDQRETYQRLNDHLSANTISISIYGYYGIQGFTQEYLIDPEYTPQAMVACMAFLQYKPGKDLGEARYKIRDLGEDDIEFSYMSVQNYAYGESYLIQTEKFTVIKEFLNNLNLSSLDDYQNKDVYHVYFDIETKALNEDEKKYDSFHRLMVDVYITLSDEDIARLNQILNYPTMPISEN